jgi:3-isopropylmalate dehydrogenase
MGHPTKIYNPSDMLLNVTVLPGDGIGPEVIDEGIKVLETVSELFGHQLKLTRKNVGGAALLASSDPLPADTLDACLASSAVLLGAIGGPAFDTYPSHLRPEAGLLRLRRELGVFANLRPATCFPGLESCSPLRAEVVRGTDLVIVRELLGGIYFGEPRETKGETGKRNAVDTMRYAEYEIERIAHIAFQMARTRRQKLMSVDKANVLDCSRLWRIVVNSVAQQYPDVALSHNYVDSAAMALVARPVEFDVVLTENMFGDILSDQAGAVVGSLGILGSASIGGKVGLYEPIHGSAPDIAGQKIANPIGTISSVGMMLRHAFGLEAEAKCVDSAVTKVLAEGARTRDIARKGEPSLSTNEMGNRIASAIHEAARPASKASN